MAGGWELVVVGASFSLPGLLDSVLPTWQMASPEQGIQKECQVDLYLFMSHRVSLPLSHSVC